MKYMFAVMLAILMTPAISYAEKKNNYIGISYYISKADSADEYCVRYYTSYPPNDLKCQDSKGFRASYGMRLNEHIFLEAGYRNGSDFSVKESNYSWYREAVVKLSGLDVGLGLRKKINDTININAKIGAFIWDAESRNGEYLLVPFYASSVSEGDAKGESLLYSVGVDIAAFSIAYEIANDVGDENTTGEGNISTISAGFKLEF